MTKKYCKLCNRVVSNFLIHLYVDHDIKTKEEYEKKAKIKEEENKKIEECQQKVRDLVGMLNRKEITAEEYRSRITKIM